MLVLLLPQRRAARGNIEKAQEALLQALQARAGDHEQAQLLGGKGLSFL